MASHTSLDIHSNEAWNYYDYILIKNRSRTIKSAHYSGTNEFNTKENARIRYDMVEVKNKFTNYICMKFCMHEVKRSVHFGHRVLTYRG